MREIFMYEKDIPEGCYCCDFRDPRYGICIASREEDDYMLCNQPQNMMIGKKPKGCPIHSVNSILGGVQDARH